MLQAVRLLTELARPTDNRRSPDMEPTPSTSSEVSVQFREIYKNGWLRRTDKTDKETSRFWVAFCVHDDSEPRLEGFTDQKQATTHSPLWANSLRGIQHISPTLCATSRHDYEFCVNFSDDRVLRLAAPTYQGMLDWVQLITRKLTDMKILRPKENVYSRGPERIATRDPTSPLPLPPSGAQIPGQVQAQVQVPTADTPIVSTSSPARDSTTPPMIFTFEGISIEDRRRHVQAQTQRAAPPTPSPRIVAVNVGTVDPAESGYESIFLASSMAPEVRNTTSTREPVLPQLDTSTDSRDRQYAVLMEYRSAGTPDIGPSGISELRSSLEGGHSSEIRSHASSDRTPGPSDLRGPGPSDVRGSGPSETRGPGPSDLRGPGTSENLRSLGSGESGRSSGSSEIVRPIPAPRSGIVGTPRQLTLREQQIYQLKREMGHRAGVRLQLGRRDCKDSIAFVDGFGSIWIAGWRQKDHPFLYNVLHVGDVVISIAGLSPPSASAIRDIMKGITTPRVEVIVRRLPYARAMTLAKRTDNEEFGLEVNGNEVSGVTGVALSAGLSPLAEATDPTAPVGSNTTWTLTEINGRPLNIFDGGAAERLRAVGRDISIVIQPTDLVSTLRKKLRAMRNYKNYILQ